MKMGLNTSGPVLDWLAARRPESWSRRRGLGEPGKVEPWGGAMYEPILPAIPEHDRQGQIAAMSERLEREVGRRPRGLWLGERGGGAGPASRLAAAGGEGTAGDRTPLGAAGVSRGQVSG